MVTETAPAASSRPNYSVKQVEQIVRGTDVLVRLFTLAPKDVIPWHHHSESHDHYFVLAGTLAITTREPDATHVVDTGEHWQITPGKQHLVRNGGSEDCRFLLVQGAGKLDFIKSAQLESQGLSAFR